MDSSYPRYSTVQFLVKHGNRFAIGLALLCMIGVIGVGWTLGSWILAVAGVLVGAVLYVIAKSYVELVQIIADMLLPKE